MKILFPDGRSITADTATDCLAMLGEKQTPPLTVPEMRTALAGRVYWMTGIRVDPMLGDDDEFVAALGRTGGVVVTTEVPL